MSVSLQEQHKLRLCLCLLRIWRQNSWSLWGDLIPGLQGDASFQRNEFQQQQQQQQQQCTRDEGVVVCGCCLSLTAPTSLRAPSPYFDFPLYHSHRNTFMSCYVGHMFYWELEDKHVYGLQKRVQPQPHWTWMKGIEATQRTVAFFPTFTRPAGQQHNIIPAFKQPTLSRMSEGNGRLMKLCRTLSTSHSTCWADKSICCQKINRNASTQMHNRSVLTSCLKTLSPYCMTVWHCPPRSPACLPLPDFRVLQPTWRKKRRAFRLPGWRSAWVLRWRKQMRRRVKRGRRGGEARRGQTRRGEDWDVIISSIPPHTLSSVTAQTQMESCMSSKYDGITTSRHIRNTSLAVFPRE